MLRIYYVCRVESTHVGEGILQQEWINDGNFIGAGRERDPIIGLQEDGATFTIPKEPVRRRVRGLETFNVLRGGEYFFMPSLSALKWLGELG